jgi:CyaY protein
MTESEFLRVADAVLSEIESKFERSAEVSNVDLECSRSGNVLEIEFIDTDSKIIINTQAPMQEIWVAARSGGFHYRLSGQQWLNTRDGSELYAALSDLASLQAGSQISL